MRSGPWDKYIVMTNCDYARHVGKKTEKDLSICIGTFRKISSGDWINMCQVVGQKLNQGGEQKLNQDGEQKLNQDEEQKLNHGVKQKINQEEKSKYVTSEINTFPQVYLKKNKTNDSLLLGGYTNLNEFCDLFKNKKYINIALNLK